MNRTGEKKIKDRKGLSSDSGMVYFDEWKWSRRTVDSLFYLRMMRASFLNKHPHPGAGLLGAKVPAIQPGILFKVGLKEGL